MPEMSIDTGKCVAMFFLAAVIGVGVYDVSALFSKGQWLTASSWLVFWSTQWPFIPFILGMVIGHLFLPSK